MQSPFYAVPGNLHGIAGQAFLRIDRGNDYSGCCVWVYVSLSHFVLRLSFGLTQKKQKVKAEFLFIRFKSTKNREQNKLVCSAGL
jgi:hypothetical protein